MRRVSAIMSGVNLSNVGPSKKKPGAHGRQLTAIGRRVCFIVLLVAGLAAPTYAQSGSSIVPGPKPPDAPQKWKELVGIYSGDEDKKLSFVLLEQGGKLLWRDEKDVRREFRIIQGETVFVPSEGTTLVGHTIA